MTYIHRFLESSFLEYLQTFPVVSLTGPRQSGKSTLLQHLLPHYRYISFDDISHIEHFERDPKDFMQVYDNHVIFDEAQKCPLLFDAIKIAVDNDRHNYGKYVISGSSQFTLLDKITESLAGRVGLLTLLPFQYAEIPDNLRQESLLYGCYPQLIEQAYQKTEAWFGSYLATYIERDVRNISNIGDLKTFQSFIYLLAANVAQQINMSRLANEVGISVPTIKRWLSILEASYIIYLVSPYYQNFGKRIIKAAKLYFYDTGLVNYLLGIRETAHLQQGPMVGALFENYIISDILKQQYHFDTHNKLYYLRTSNQEEIDLLIDKKRSLDFLEIKKNATLKPKMVATIKSFIREQDQGYIIYTGESQRYSKQIEAINYQQFLLRGRD